MGIPLKRRNSLALLKAAAGFEPSNCGLQTLRSPAGSGCVVWVSGVCGRDGRAGVENEHPPSAPEACPKKLIDALGAELSRGADRNEPKGLLSEQAGGNGLRECLDGKPPRSALRWRRSSAAWSSVRVSAAI